MESPDTELIIPGSFKGPLILGPGNCEVKDATGIMEGLEIFQDDPDLFSVNISLCRVKTALDIEIFKKHQKFFPTILSIIIYYYNLNG